MNILGHRERLRTLVEHRSRVERLVAYAHEEALAHWFAELDALAVKEVLTSQIEQHRAEIERLENEEPNEREVDGGEGQPT